MTLRRLTRATTLAALTAAGLIIAAASASAHVTVHSDQAVAGATDAAITFRVPNEETKAQTTKFQVIFPTDHPLIGVLVRDHPGWTADVQTAKLPTPVSTDDGLVSDAVSRVTWTGGAITGDNYDDFEVSAGQLPKDVTDLTFKAIQTYSNGDVVSWIDTAPPGAPNRITRPRSCTSRPLAPRRRAARTAAPVRPSRQPARPLRNPTAPTGCCPSPRWSSPSSRHYSPPQVSSADGAPPADGPFCARGGIRPRVCEESTGGVADHGVLGVEGLPLAV